MGSSVDEERHHRTVPSVYFFGCTIPRDARVTGGATGAATGGCGAGDPDGTKSAGDPTWLLSGGVADPVAELWPAVAGEVDAEDPGGEGARGLDLPAEARWRGVVGAELRRTADEGVRADA